MIHARDDYNRIQDPAGNIGEDEPVFLIRARDRVSVEAVRQWADLHVSAGGDPTLRDLAYDHAEKMFEWQKKNGCKLADL